MNFLGDELNLRKEKRRGKGNLIKYIPYLLCHVTSLLLHQCKLVKETKQEKEYNPQTVYNSIKNKLKIQDKIYTN